MVVGFKFSALKEGRWYEYVLRFVLGGLATVAAGVVADVWGASHRGTIFGGACNFRRERHAHRKA